MTDSDDIIAKLRDYADCVSHVAKGLSRTDSVYQANYLQDIANRLHHVASWLAALTPRTRNVILHAADAASDTDLATLSERDRDIVATIRAFRAE